MKAAVCTGYGLDNLKIEEVPKPVPKEDGMRRKHGKLPFWNTLSAARSFD